MFNLETPRKNLGFFLFLYVTFLTGIRLITYNQTTNTMEKLIAILKDHDGETLIGTLAYNGIDNETIKQAEEAGIIVINDPVVYLVEKTHVIRFGGLVESFYISETHQTCHKLEATKFSEEEATRLADKLRPEYSCGVRAVKA